MVNLSAQIHIACCFALSGHPDKAMEYLLGIEKHWRNWKHLAEDTDLASLADREDFKALIGRHDMHDDGDDRYDSDEDSDEDE